MTEVHDEVQKAEPAATFRSGSRRHRTVTVAAIGVIALAAGIAVGWFAGTGTARPTVADAPNVLDRWEDLPEVEPVGEHHSVRDGDTRLLGEIEGEVFTGTIGSGADDFFRDQELVCLDVRRDDDTGVGSCAPRHLFEEHGIWITASGSGWRAAYVWTAYSPPARVSCAPDDWLLSCPAG